MKFSKNKNTKIGELLVQKNILTVNQLESAIQTQNLKRQEKLGEILVNMGAASDMDISRVIAKKNGLPLPEYPGS